MTTVSKNVYFDILDNNVFATGYTQNWSEEVFIITRIKDTVPWIYAISDLNVEPNTGTFY